MIDLHIHSTFSDGSFTPYKLVQMAVNLGLKGIALTDHDTVAGLAEFVSACNQLSMPYLQGVEISADVDKGTMHILGYGINPDNNELQDALGQLRNGRDIRNKQILGKLQQMGFDLNWEDVATLAGEDVVGRPHFAMALMAKGYVSSKEEAFENYLAKGKPAYVNRVRLTPEESIKLITKAGGLAVLAHPYSLELSDKSLCELIERLQKYGLAGIESYYSEHTPEMTKKYLVICEKYHLIPTGGSDFHGELNPKLKMGTGFGNLSVPDEIIYKIKSAISSGTLLATT